MKVAGIYALVNKINGRIYVGQSVDIANRLAVHKRNIARQDKKKYAIYNALNKYGWDNFYKIVLYYCNMDIANIAEVKKDLTGKENFWINHFKNKNIVLYNIRDAVDSNLGIRFSSSAKRNMGLSHLGRKLTEETKNKIRIAQKGVPKTKEHIANIRKANLGKKLSDAHKKKMSDSAKRRIASPEQREKISAGLKAYFAKIKNNRTEI